MSDLELYSNIMPQDWEYHWGKLQDWAVSGHISMEYADVFILGHLVCITPFLTHVQLWRLLSMFSLFQIFMKSWSSL